MFLLNKGVLQLNSEKLQERKEMYLEILENAEYRLSSREIAEKVFDTETKLRVGFDIEEIQLDMPFDNNMINHVFSSGLSGIGSWNRSSLSEYTKDKLFPVNIKAGNNLELVAKNFLDLGGHINSANTVISDRRKEYKFRKITAESSEKQNMNFP